MNLMDFCQRPPCFPPEGLSLIKLIHLTTELAARTQICSCWQKYILLIIYSIRPPEHKDIRRHLCHFRYEASAENINHLNLPSGHI